MKFKYLLDLLYWNQLIAWLYIIPNILIFFWIAQGRGNLNRYYNILYFGILLVYQILYREIKVFTIVIR